MAGATATITIDQFVAAAREKVWRGLTDPVLLARWWAHGDIAPVVGHRFHMQMPGFGSVPCTVLEVRAPEHLVYTFNDWTLTWTLVAEGRGTRLLLEHSGFDLADARMRQAFQRMGPGWRDEVLPRLSALIDADDPSV
jgi:uncharacterized protein YndB with AHSA1/START domain